MKFLTNPFVIAFFDDMVEVGLSRWGVWTLLAALLTYGLWGSSFIPLVNAIGVIITANLLLAFLVTTWWKHHGREKYAGGSIIDIAKQAKGRDT